jgi:hypothetical protein
MRACTGKYTARLKSAAVAPTLQGLSWELMIECVFDKAWHGAGSRLGVYCVPRNLPKGTYATCSYQLQYTISSPTHTLDAVLDRLQTGGQGWRDFFDLGVMAGGWDEAAWAAKGLPSHGTLQLKLKVKPSP